MSDIVLLRARRLDLNRAIIFHVLVLAADLCGSIIFRNDCRHADARSWVLITIAFGVIPVLIAGTTTVRIFPFLVSAANLSACLSAAIVFADRMLLSQFPTFTLLYLGLSLALLSGSDSWKRIKKRTFDLRNSTDYQTPEHEL